MTRTRDSLADVVFAPAAQAFDKGDALHAVAPPLNSAATFASSSVLGLRRLE